MVLVALAVTARGEDQPEARALAYLSREVPRWSAEHHCFSCHNNGDAARALYGSIRLGRSISTLVTADTDDWLARPEDWDRKGAGEAASADSGLARIQFTSTLAAAVASGRVQDRVALDRAIRQLANDQAEDGSWPVEDGGRVGSPATYGRPLASAMALETLRNAKLPEFALRIARAEQWFRILEPGNIPDTAARRLALAQDTSPGSLLRRSRDLEFLKRSQSSDGGWGPFEKSPPEVFDTALVLLALDRYREVEGITDCIKRGRVYLLANQDEDGSWVETTRPSGGESYAQRLSTSGWATRALIEIPEVSIPYPTSKP